LFGDTDLRVEVSELQEILNCTELHELAVAQKFCQRESKLKPEVFFDVLFYVASRSQNVSLEAMSSYLEAEYGIVMGKQSIDERFTEKTVNFVNAVVIKTLERKISQMLYVKNIFGDFNHIRIKDSTKFNIPSNLAEHYKGSGAVLFGRKK